MNWHLTLHSSRDLRGVLQVGEGQVLEIRHPVVPEKYAAMVGTGGFLRRGVIGSGRPVVSDPLLRENFAAQHELLAYDSEYDQVRKNFKILFEFRFMLKIMLFEAVMTTA